MCEKNVLYHLIFVAVLLCVSCSSKTSRDNQQHLIHLKQPVNFSSEFDDHFTFVDEIVFKVAGSKDFLLPPSLRSLDITNENSYLIPNAYTGKVGVFDSLGKLVTFFGEKGRGPGEFEVISKIHVDNDDNVWVYDPAQLRLSKFINSSYELSNTYNLRNRLNDFIVQSEDTIIYYSLFSDTLLHKYSLTNNQAVKSTYQVDKSSDRIFMGRFQDGGTAKGFEDDQFYFIYPGKYEIRKYNTDLQIVKNLASKESDYHEFRPEVPNFPNNLNPYHFDREHQKWWNSFLHLGRVYSIEPDIILVSLYKLTGLRSGKFYLNIYDTEGNIKAEGIELPDDYRIVTTKDKYLYISDNEYDNKEVNYKAKLLVFKLK